MSKYQLSVSEDQAVVLFEFFERFDDTEELYFVHRAEYIAFQKLAGQFSSTTSAMFDPNYRKILGEARERIPEGYEGEVPLLRRDNDIG